MIIIEEPQDAFQHHQICDDQVCDPVLVLKCVNADCLSVKNAAAEIVEVPCPPSSILVFGACFLICSAIYFALMKFGKINEMPM